MKRERGYSYVIALFAVAVLAIFGMRAVENTLTKERRDKEEELLFVGMAFRDAIRSYYENSPGTVKKYPPDLEALLLDSRTSVTRRHLRKIYRDPVTGGEQWGVLAGEDGNVIGVYSLSTQQPVKVGGFPDSLVNFTDARKYQDWQFVYKPS